MVFPHKILLQQINLFPFIKKIIISYLLYCEPREGINGITVMFINFFFLCRTFQLETVLGSLYIIDKNPITKCVQLVL